MKKREDINKVMIIGSGPIIIGQACATSTPYFRGNILLDMDSEHSTPMTIRATSSRDAVISIVHFRLPHEVFPCFRAQPVFPTPLGVLFFFLLFFVLPVIPVKGVSFPFYPSFSNTLSSFSSSSPSSPSFSTIKFAYRFFFPLKWASALPKPVID